MWWELGFKTSWNMQEGKPWRETLQNQRNKQPAPKTHAGVHWEQARDGQKVWAAMGYSVQCSSVQVQPGTEIRGLEGNHCRKRPPAFGAHHPAQGWAPVLRTCAVQHLWTCSMSYSVIFARRVASEKECWGKTEGTICLSLPILICWCQKI